MELEIYQESRDALSNLPFPVPIIKKSDTRDSISSVDSDLSLSFDRRGSKGEEADLSDYESEIKDVEKTDLDQDSGIGSMDEKQVSVKNNQKLESTLETPLIRKTITEEDDTFTPPNDELADKICAQVEFYFSDENIIKDAFLLKHVKRNKEGYVSLKLITSFKKVKHLSKDWRVVGAALARSKKLEINPQGTKLRRIDRLPPFDQTTPSRTILAARLPVEKLTVQSVAEIFKRCGEITLIRVLKPGHPAPSELRQAIFNRPELAPSEECAMIEFTDSSSARIAMQMTLGDAKIFELHSTTEKKRKHQSVKKSAVNKVIRKENYNTSSCPSGSEPEDGKIRHRRNVQGYPIYHIHTAYPIQGLPSSDAWLSRELSSCSISSSENNFILRRLSSCSGSGSSSDSGRRYSACSSGSDTAFYHPSYPSNIYHHESRRYSCCSSIGSVTGCEGDCFVKGRRRSTDYEPYLRKTSTCTRDNGRHAVGYDINTRKVSSMCPSNLEQNGFCRSRSNGSIAMTHLPDNVTRMPSGPDGTRGFFSRSSRILIPTRSAC